MSRRRLCAAVAWIAAAAFCRSLCAADPIVIAMPDVVPLRGFPNVSTDYVSARFWPLLFDGLTEVGDGGAIVPALATEWHAIDPLTWEFAIRPHVLFSNEEPVDSEAVADSINYLKSAEAVGLPIAVQVANIAKVEPKDALHLTITTKVPDAMLPARLRAIKILPPRYFQAVGRVAFAKAPQGTGPYVAQKLERARSVFVPNPHAWRRPRWSEIDFVPVGDSVARAEAIVSGAADIAFNTGPSVGDTVEAAGGRLLAYDIGSVDAIPMVTVLDTPLRDRRVRHAVNKKRLITAFVRGATSPATQFVPNGTFGFTPGLPEAFPFDPERAKALLAEAGYPQGFQTAMEVWIDGTDQAAIYQQVAADLGNVGIKVRIIQVPVLKWQSEGLFGGKWEAPMFNFAYNALPTFDALEALVTHSCLWARPFNCDQAFAQKIVDARNTFDRPARLAKTQALYRALLEDPVAILLFPSIRFDAVGRRMVPYEAPFGFLPFDRLEKRPQ